MHDARLLTVTTEITETTTRVGLTGELDIDGAPDVVRELVAAANDDVERVVLDVSHLSFLDSAGLRAILESRRNLQDAGVVFTVEGVSGPVERVLEATGVRKLLTER